MIIKDWLYAIAVCKKYKISWVPFRVSRSKASYCTKADKPEWRGIWMSPFHESFLNTFMHEVGHHVYRKNGRHTKGIKNHRVKQAFNKVNMFYGSEPILHVLEEESKATRFTRKAIGERFNKEQMLKYFYTYTHSFYSASHRLNQADRSFEITDVVYKCIRRIEK